MSFFDRSTLVEVGPGKLRVYELSEADRAMLDTICAAERADDERLGPTCDACCTRDRPRWCEECSPEEEA